MPPPCLACFFAPRRVHFAFHAYTASYGVFATPCHLPRAEDDFIADSDALFFAAVYATAPQRGAAAADAFFTRSMLMLFAAVAA